jgi:hypothetical protein
VLTQEAEFWGKWLVKVKIRSLYQSLFHS